MNATHADPSDPGQVFKGAVISGVINAVINGGIQYFMLKDSSTIAMSVDSISTKTHTVLGSAVPLAVSLAMILTAVAYWTLKTSKIPFFPRIFWMVIRHGLMAFGGIVTFAVLWQRFVGTVEVGLGTAVVVLGIVAGLIATVVNYLTILEAVKK